jgi:hypothetical protein
MIQDSLNIVTVNALRSDKWLCVITLFVSYNGSILSVLTRKNYLKNGSAVTAEAKTSIQLLKSRKMEDKNEQMILPLILFQKIIY